MRVELNFNNNRPAFGAKISKELDGFMKYYIHHHPNILQNTYKYNAKIESLKNSGFDNYTIDIIQNSKGWLNEFSLVAIKDGSKPKSKSVLLKRNTQKDIVKAFYDKLNKHLLNYRIHN